jgi:hypothetical protein
MYSGISAGSVQGGIVNLVTSLVNLLNQIQLEESKFSAFADSDLEGIGISATDLPLLKAALADANAIAEILFTGLPPGTYPQPASAYIYFNSMKQLTGP